MEDKNKILSELSELLKTIGRQSEQATRYELAVDNFVQAAKELLITWEGIDKDLEPQITHNSTYPFDMSFDEKLYEIVRWNADIKEQISLWREKI